MALGTALAGDRDEAEDLVQVVIERVVRHPERVENTDRGFGYLMTGIKREFLHLRERRATATALKQQLTVEPLRTQPRTPEQETWRRIVGAAVRRAVAALPPRQREAFLYVRVHGYSYRATAARMSCAIKTVENHVRLATANLRRNPRLAAIAES